MKIIRNLLLSAAMLWCGSILPAGAQTDAGTTTGGVPMVQLNNGVLMPRFGLGTFLQGSDEVCRQSCLTALKAGYRHIDTAHAYDDERGVGQAVKESSIPRSEIWITSKLWPTEYGEGKTAAQVILRWHIQEGFSVIPGATDPGYIKENIQIFDFALTDEEMQAMRSLNKEQRFFHATLEQAEQFGRTPMKD